MLPTRDLCERKNKRVGTINFSEFSRFDLESFERFLLFLVLAEGRGVDVDEWVVAHPGGLLCRFRLQPDLRWHRFRPRHQRVEIGRVARIGGVGLCVVKLGRDTWGCGENPGPKEDQGFHCSSDFFENSIGLCGLKS